MGLDACQTCHGTWSYTVVVLQRVAAADREVQQQARAGLAHPSLRALLSLLQVLHS